MNKLILSNQKLDRKIFKFVGTIFCTNAQFIKFRENHHWNDSCGRPARHTKPFIAD